MNKLKENKGFPKGKEKSNEFYTLLANRFIHKFSFRRLWNRFSDAFDWFVNNAVLYGWISLLILVLILFCKVVFLDFRVF